MPAQKSIRDPKHGAISGSPSNLRVNTQTITMPSDHGPYCKRSCQAHHDRYRELRRHTILDMRNRDLIPMTSTLIGFIGDPIRVVGIPMTSTLIGFIGDPITPVVPSIYKRALSLAEGPSVPSISKRALGLAQGLSVPSIYKRALSLTQGLSIPSICKRVLSLTQGLSVPSIYKRAPSLAQGFSIPSISKRALSLA
ncbi:hypothetical protein BHE74_00030718 [Ensete ventricosum]|nr:hypothetical protein BHE74_00030718 [Ensete ventricosum]